VVRLFRGILSWSLAESHDFSDLEGELGGFSLLESGLRPLFFQLLCNPRHHLPTQLEFPIPDEETLSMTIGSHCRFLLPTLRKTHTASHIIGWQSRLSTPPSFEISD
jgi:hypothetical protein